jgi:hypothetical protein
MTDLKYRKSEYRSEYTAFATGWIMARESPNRVLLGMLCVFELLPKCLINSGLVGIKSPASLWKDAGPKMEPPVRVELTT